MTEPNTQAAPRRVDLGVCPCYGVIQRAIGAPEATCTACGRVYAMLGATEAQLAAERADLAEAEVLGLLRRLTVSMEATAQAVRALALQVEALAMGREIAAERAQLAMLERDEPRQLLAEGRGVNGAS